MQAMQSLRHLTTLTRLVLAWFVLSLGVAVASPIVKPQDILLVCSAAGAMKVLVKAADGSTTEVGSNTMDCPLCAPMAAPPPPVFSLALAHVHPPVYALRGILTAHMVARTAAPLPPRGPPIDSKLLIS
jgi:hypothetical protein